LEKIPNPIWRVIDITLRSKFKDAAAQEEVSGNEIGRQAEE